MAQTLVELEIKTQFPSELTQFFVEVFEAEKQEGDRIEIGNLFWRVKKGNPSKVKYSFQIYSQTEFNQITQRVDFFNYRSKFKLKQERKKRSLLITDPEGRVWHINRL